MSGNVPIERCAQHISDQADLLSEKDEIIIDLIHKLKEAEDGLVFRQLENDGLQNQIDELKRSQKSSISYAQIADYVKNQFEDGNVPVPDDVLRYKLPYSIECNEGDIELSSSGLFLAKVTFRSYGYDLHVDFEFMLVPEEPQRIYPRFVCTYESKPVPEKRVRKPVKKPAVNAPSQAT